jgi:hypothetical protein
MKNTVFGLIGIGMLVATIASIVAIKVTSPPIVISQLVSCLFVLILGVIAAIRGRKGWLGLCLASIAVAILLVFGVVGP